MRHIETKVVEKIKTHILYLINSSRNLAISEIMWKKYDRSREVAYDNIIQYRKDGINMPDNLGKNTETHL
jgi:hypothetical protein